MDEQVWKVKDVAEFLQASESWVRHAAAGGRLPCTKLGGLLRFDPAEIRALVRGEASPARALPSRGG
jgi:predicted DNA-binding transcriptional regulator AlpA